MIMIFRSQDIPGLESLTEQHRQQIMVIAAKMVFWKPASLLLSASLAIAFCAAIVLPYWTGPTDNMPSWLWGCVPAVGSYGCWAIYWLTGINSFFRPAIRSMLEAGLPPETPEVKRPTVSPGEQFTVIAFVLTVFLLFALLGFSTTR
ncbi:hypothetical protein GC176_11490 [bacterium]|nr:hypothetical protein [bacterium]